MLRVDSVYIKTGGVGVAVVAAAVFCNYYFDIEEASELVISF